LIKKFRDKNNKLTFIETETIFKPLNFNIVISVILSFLTDWFMLHQVIYTVRQTEQSTVEDVLNALKSKVNCINKVYILSY
jgi:hypothetical protein